MTIMCGKCGACINPTSEPKWYTHKTNPEVGCSECGHGMKPDIKKY